MLGGNGGLPRSSMLGGDGVLLHRVLLSGDGGHSSLLLRYSLSTLLPVEFHRGTMCGG
jgi:hypothetical protein